jgi:hypothetical protein
MVCVAVIPPPGATGAAPGGTAPGGGTAAAPAGVGVAPGDAAAGIGAVPGAPEAGLAPAGPAAVGSGAGPVPASGRPVGAGAAGSCGHTGIEPVGGAGGVPPAEAAGRWSPLPALSLLAGCEVTRPILPYVGRHWVRPREARRRHGAVAGAVAQHVRSGGRDVREVSPTSRRHQSSPR